jgi:LacI family transcriptional regulator
MEHIRSGKQLHDQGTIAILVDAESEADWICHDETYKMHFEGFMRRAEHRGFRTECFFLQEKGLSDEIIDRILYSRGISGVILAAPDRLRKKSFSFKWERYAIATISYEWNFLSIDRVSSDLRYNTFLAFNKLIERGYEHIGLALPPSALNKLDSNWLASYLSCQYYLFQSRRLPIFVGSPSTCSVSTFRSWYNRWKPDALLCLLGEELEWMEQIGLSPLEDMALVCLNRPLNSKFSGVEENSILVGELASDIVVNHIIHNERGLSDHPQMILVRGTWVEGETLPSQKPPKEIKSSARQPRKRQSIY